MAHRRRSRRPDGDARGPGGRPHSRGLKKPLPASPWAAAQVRSGSCSRRSGRARPRSRPWGLIGIASSRSWCANQRPRRIRGAHVEADEPLRNVSIDRRCGLNDPRAALRRQLLTGSAHDHDHQSMYSSIMPGQSAPGRDRTCDHRIRSPLLCPLSSKVPAARRGRRTSRDRLSGLPPAARPSAGARRQRRGRSQPRDLAATGPGQYHAQPGLPVPTCSIAQDRRTVYTAGDEASEMRD